MKLELNRAKTTVLSVVFATILYSIFFVIGWLACQYPVQVLIGLISICSIGALSGNIKVSLDINEEVKNSKVD